MSLFSWFDKLLFDLKIGNGCIFVPSDNLLQIMAAGRSFTLLDTFLEDSLYGDGKHRVALSLWGLYWDVPQFFKGVTDYDLIAVITLDKGYELVKKDDVYPVHFPLNSVVELLAVTGCHGVKSGNGKYHLVKRAYVSGKEFLLLCNRACFDFNKLLRCYPVVDVKIPVDIYHNCCDVDTFNDGHNLLELKYYDVKQDCECACHVPLLSAEVVGDFAFLEVPTVFEDYSSKLNAFIFEATH